MTDPLFEINAKRILQAALDENRAGELLLCLFEGGSATIAEGNKLILVDGDAIKALTIELNGPLN